MPRLSQWGGEVIRIPRPASVKHFIDPGSGRFPRPDDSEPRPFIR